MPSQIADDKKKDGPVKKSDSKKAVAVNNEHSDSSSGSNAAGNEV